MPSGEFKVFDADFEEIAESAYGNRITFQGREYSWATGLYYFRARWYEPVTGRWLSKDPIGISGGLNQYVAFENNPIIYIDPTGLRGAPPASVVNHQTKRAQESLAANFLKELSPFGPERPRSPRSEMKWWEKLEAGHYYGTGFGEDALQHYADMTVDPSNPWYVKGCGYVGGFFSALWTPDTYQQTGWTLIGSYGARNAGRVWQLRDGSPG